VEDLPDRFVRPYVITGGRTRVDGLQLPIETVVKTVGSAWDLEAGTPTEVFSIIDLCHAPTSIAEVAVHLRVPVGVARVLVGDLVGSGLLQAGSTSGEGMERVRALERLLDGIRAL
jgi:hypothetical protein